MTEVDGEGVADALTLDRGVGAIVSVVQGASSGAAALVEGETRSP